jgi:tetratricopeptide (TPR) repeat protein
MRYESGFARALAFFILLIAGVSAAPLCAQDRGDALLEYRRGNFDTAVAICKSEITANPNNIEAHIVLCWSLLKLARYAEAATYAEAAAKLARYDVRVVEILGEVEFFRGRNTLALQYFQEYINLAPEGQRIDVVYYYIGEIYIRLGRFRHADIAIFTALHYVSGNAQWWTRLAYAREMAGDKNEAAKAYAKALELNASLIDARRGLERVREGR